MYDQEIRWRVLVPVSILLGFGMLAAEIFGLCPNFPARPDLFFCLAFLAGRRAPPVPTIVAFAWCGVVRDLLLGPKLGAATLAYVIAGWLVLYWKPLMILRVLPVQAAVVASTSLLAALLKHGFDAGRLVWGIFGRILFVSAADTVLTMLFFVPVVLVLSIPSFRPWRERGAYYF